MSVVTEELEIDRPAEQPIEGTGGPGAPVDAGGGDDGSGGSSRPGGDRFPISKGRLGMWLLLTGVTMLFAGLASAYIITSGGPWWQTIQVPSLLWANTFVLLASSATIERTRHLIQRDDQAGARTWIALTGVLGLAFLVGQLVAWEQLVDAGIYLPSTLHSSFFYILTGLHGLHLLGGVSALAYTWVQIFRNRYTGADHEQVSLTTMYWHFMDGLWVCVFLLLILV